MSLTSWRGGLGSWLNRNGRRRRLGRPATPRAPFWIERLETRSLLSMFTVLNTNDSGAGSLRQAILDANAAAGADTIAFSIGGGGVQTISPLSQLPTVSGPVTIDGTTQPGFAGAPLIELSGASAGSAHGLVITAGNSTIRGLVINRFSGTGIVFFTNGGNVVEGNYLGTNVAGTAALGNGNWGVFVGTSNNRIGTNGDGVNDAAERNLISGNGLDGVRISGGNNNVVAGNYIGTDVSGSSAVGNALDGVFVLNGSFNRIGTNGDGVADAAERNVISANHLDGVRIDGGNNNVVAGNYIGTDVTGTYAIGNSFQGVNLDSGASSNRIGTNGDGVADAAEGNLISGNAVTGVRISDVGTDHNVVAGNLIGTDKTGMVAIPNLGDGVFIGSGAQFTQIGTNADGLSDALERNIISGAAHNGIRIDNAYNNTVAGNYIGINITGTAAIGNSDAILIHDGAHGNLIGTNGDGIGDEAERNVISGNHGSGVNSGSGVTINGANDNVVAGNYIGTDVTGTVALGNHNIGVQILNGSFNVIGTDGNGVDDAAEGNLISGQGNTGVNIGVPGTAPQDSHSNVVAGNLIGTDKTGTLAIANHGDAIFLGFGSHDNRVGTNADGVSDALERNIISAAPNNGVRIDAADHNTIAGNYIGTNAAGTAALGNFNGVLLHDGAHGNLIGTNGDGVRDSSERNILSGNTIGILIQDSGTTGNLVAGNYIGTDVTGVAALPNHSMGVFFAFGAQANQIGGSPALANTIAFNAVNGVVVRDAGTVNNRIQANSIHDNGSLGIDLGNDGFTLNDPLDPDDGPNHLQNFPVIISSIPGATTQITGRFNSKPNTSYVLDFYANTAADPSGFGEGQRYLGAATVTTDGSGNVRFTIVVPGASAAGELITATATDPDGNTSEFSGNRPPIANAGGPYTVPEGQGVTLDASASSDPDPDDTLTYSWDINGDGIFGDAVGVKPSFTWTQLNAFGINDGPQQFSVRVRVDDDAGHVVTSSATTLTVTNVAPTALDDSGTTNEDQAVPLNVLANDSDPAGAFDPLQIISVTSGTKGTTAIDTKGTADTTDDVIVYTPNLGATGSDSFSYTISDGDGGTATATVTVQIRNLVDVAGRVFDDKDNDGAFEPAEGDAGLGGVTVQLYNDSSASPIATQTTAADGTYFFDSDLGAGTYKIVAALPAGYLDGKETAGNLGGTVDNTQDSNQISAISVGAPGTTADAVDYLFAKIRPSQALGLVWSDFNNDGQVGFGEMGIAGVSVQLTGLDDRGNAVSRNFTTDANGIYTLTDLRPSSAAGYTIHETQPAGFADGIDTLGTINGVPAGDNSVNDTFSALVLPVPGSMAEDYNFGERPPSTGGVAAGQTATIGFWQNSNGQNLINALNGGPTATQLGNWLASTFSNMYGASAGPNNLTGKTNAEVASFYKTLFARTAATAAGGGPAKMDAQVMDTALSVYVTNQTLAGTTAAAYGFQVTQNGLGTRTFNVSSNGAAFGVADNSQVSILDLLLAVNSRSKNGLLYDLDGDGDATDAQETSDRTMANNLFTAINQAGDI